MKKLIHFDPDQAGQLHCDACGFDLPGAQAFVPGLIGTRCPTCGANMLTVSDFRKTTRLFKAIHWINRWFGWLGSEKYEEDWAHLTMRVHDDTLEFKVHGKQER